MQGAQSGPNFWKFTQDTTLDAGRVIAPSRSEELGVAAGTEPSMREGNDILVMLIDSSQPQTRSIDAQFSVSEDGVPEDGWLHPDGTVSAHACD